MTISQMDMLGLIAAGLQVAGYAIYIRNFQNEAIKPNAASFLMFAYGTTFLAFLEWKSGAHFAVLALPLVCAALGVVVGLMCLRAGATEPIDRIEARAFWTDVWLTLFYMGFALGFDSGQRFVIPFLIATNLSAIVCFIPILRSTWHTPERELPTSWALWTSAYLTLTIATLGAHGLSHPELLLYPLLNALLHIAVMLLSLRRPIARALYRLSQDALRIADSAIDGLGLFAGRSFAAGEVICQLTGTVKRKPGQSLPNWIGIGPGHWIDPALPLQHINHSCSANAAFGHRRQLYALRAIGVDEEITLDYSTTEADASWTMACSCQSTACRQGLFAIHISFAGQDVPPPASPLMQLVWRKRRLLPSGDTAFPQLVDRAVTVPLPEVLPAQ